MGRGRSSGRHWGGSNKTWLTTVNNLGRGGGDLGLTEIMGFGLGEEEGGVILVVRDLRVLLFLEVATIIRKRMGTIRAGFSEIAIEGREINVAVEKRAGHIIEEGGGLFMKRAWLSIHVMHRFETPIILPRKERTVLGFIIRVKREFVHWRKRGVGGVGHFWGVGGGLVRRRGDRVGKQKWAIEGKRKHVSKKENK